MPGAQCTRSLACEMEVSTRASSPQVHQNNPAFPHAMVYGLLRALPGDQVLLSPSPTDQGIITARSGRVASASLTPTLGRQNHTTSLSASASFVQHAVTAHGQSPPCDPRRAPNAAASTASRPASVTIAIRPSSGTRRFGYASDLGQARSEIFLISGLDTISENQK